MHCKTGRSYDPMCAVGRLSIGYLLSKRLAAAVGLLG